MSNEEIWKMDLENAVRKIQSDLTNLHNGLAQDLSNIMAALTRIERALKGPTVRGR